MPEFVNCPECGQRVRKGSTFCIECGSRLAGKRKEGKKRMQKQEETPSEAEDLTDLERRMLGLLGNEKAIYSQDSGQQSKQQQNAKTNNIQNTPTESSEDLEWEVKSEEQMQPAVESQPQSTQNNAVAAENASGDANADLSKQEADLSWDVADVPEMEPDDVQEGMPFKEVEPPKVKSSGPAPSPREAKDHLFPEDEDACAREAVSHLFPQGRGVTDDDFIDVVVGKPQKISVQEPMKELEQPTCPSCGSALTSDGFEYPPYVYEAMGKARIEHGEELLDKNEHEEAIESFEKAKLLYEQANDEKKIEKCREKIDDGYESMAEFHYDQAEQHKKNREYEWAIVQYKKAREIYMLTTKRKERAKCAEKVRECYADWGEEIEERGDYLAKENRTREALAKYQKAAEKYRQGEDKKRLKGLEKKIREA